MIDRNHRIHWHALTRISGRLWMTFYQYIYVWVIVSPQFNVISHRKLVWCVQYGHNERVCVVRLWHVFWMTCIWPKPTLYLRDSMFRIPQCRRARSDSDLTPRPASSSLHPTPMWKKQPFFRCEYNKAIKSNLQRLFAQFPARLHPTELIIKTIRRFSSWI